MDFLKKLNETIFKYHPHALMIAEESTSWPLISKPVYMGGMGFNYKWNMGWMNDMLDYVSLDPIYRKWNQDKITFSLMYAFSENFVLPLSHDEVVHGKRSLIEKMPGDYWQKFAGLRGFFGYWIAHPGKKLLFMGGEFGHFIEWNFDDSMDWHLVEQYPMHTKMLAYSKALNKFYVENTCFWQVDFDWSGFQWIDCNDNENSIIALVRRADDPSDFLVCVHNFTPEVHQGYRIGVPTKGTYVEVFNSDEEAYGGSGVVNAGDLVSEDYAYHGREQSIVITVPPLASTFYRLKRQSGAGTPVSKLPEIADAVAKKRATPAQPKAAAARKKSAAADEGAKPAPKKKGAVKAKAETAAEEKPAPKKRASAKKSTAESDADAKPAPKKTRTVKAKTEESAEEKPAPKKRAAAKKPAAEKVGAQGMTAVKKKTVRKTAQGAEDAPQKARSTKG